MSRKLCQEDQRGMYDMWHDESMSMFYKKIILVHSMRSWLAIPLTTLWQYTYIDWSATILYTYHTRTLFNQNQTSGTGVKDSRGFRESGSQYLGYHVQIKDLFAFLKKNVWWDLTLIPFRKIGKKFRYLRFGASKDGLDLMVMDIFIFLHFSDMQHKL